MDYLSRQTVRARDPQRVRERIVETLAKSIRNYLAWLRDALRLLERRIRGPAYDQPLVLSPSVRPLPRDYASAFHHTDADNNTLDDDYARLLRHILPGPTPGTYRLTLTEKPPAHTFARPFALTYLLISIMNLSLTSRRLF